MHSCYKGMQRTSMLVQARGSVAAAGRQVQAHAAYKSSVMPAMPRVRKRQRGSGAGYTSVAAAYEVVAAENAAAQRWMLQP